MPWTQDIFENLELKLPMPVRSCRAPVGTYIVDHAQISRCVVLMHGPAEDTWRGWQGIHPGASIKGTLTREETLELVARDIALYRDRRGTYA